MITTKYPRGIFIQWDVKNKNGTPITDPLEFEIERSGSNGDWIRIGRVKDQLWYYDNFLIPDNTNEANLLSMSRNIYYRVTVVDQHDNYNVSEAVDQDGVVANDPKQQTLRDSINIYKRKTLLRRKIIRDETIALQILNGIELKIQKKRHFGTRCPVCYDKTTKMPTQSKCRTCFGTGWAGGYYPGITTWGRMTPGAYQQGLTNEGLSYIGTTQLTLLHYPRVDPGDLVVEVDTNRRWLVKQVAPTELRRMPVHQRVVVTEIPRGSVEYLLAHITAQQVTLSFTSPTNANPIPVRGQAAPSSDVGIYVNDQLVATTKSSLTGAWSTFLTLAEGSYTIYAEATQPNGVSMRTSARPILVDRTAPPGPTITTPSAWSATDNMFEVSGVAEPNAFVTVMIDGNPNGTQYVTTVADSAGNWRVQVTQ